MKNIYIAKDFNNDIIGLFLSDNVDYIHTFLLGRGDLAHSIEMIDLNDPNIFSQPLITLITSYTKKGYDLKDSENYRFCKRGL